MADKKESKSGSGICSYVTASSLSSDVLRRRAGRSMMADDEQVGSQHPCEDAGDCKVTSSKELEGADNPVLQIREFRQGVRMCLSYNGNEATCAIFGGDQAEFIDPNAYYNDITSEDAFYEVSERVRAEVISRAV